MKTFKHSGKMGDCIFALAAIQAMGGGILYLPERAPEVPNLYSQMYHLLKAQPYIHDVLEYPDCDQYETMPLKVDIDLDRHRTHRQRGKVNMVQRYFDVFGIKQPVPWKWLEVNPIVLPEPHTVFALTNRFRERSRVNWNRVFNQVEGVKYFVGTSEEHVAFQAKCGPVQRWHTGDVLEMAEFIAVASALYCNQSLPLALAIALGKPYFCDFKYGRTNCRFYTENEHSL